MTPWTAAYQASCPLLSPGVCSNSCSLSQWYYPTNSSSATPFSSCLQSFPASAFFLMSRLFTSGAQVLELQLQHQSFQGLISGVSFRIDWFDLFAVQGTPKSLLQHQSQKHQFFSAQLSLWWTLTSVHDYWTTTLTIWTFIGKVTSDFNMLSRFVIVFLPRSKHFLISWQQSPSAVIWERGKIKSVTAPTFYPSICPAWWDQMPWF